MAKKVTGKADVASATQKEENTVPAKGAKKEVGATEELIKPQLEFIPLNQLRVVYNPRKKLTGIEELAESIKHNGQKVALRVSLSEDKLENGSPIYDIVFGHRRFAALQSLGKKYADSLVKAEVEPAGYDAIQRAYDHIASNEGEPLNMLEQGELYATIRTAGNTDAEIARKAGKSHTQIVDCLLIFDKATPSLKKDIIEGKTSATNVVELLRKNDAPEAEAKMNKAKESAGDKRVTKKHITDSEAKGRASKTNNTSSNPVKVVKEDETKKEEETASEDKSLKKLKSLEAALMGMEEPKNEENMIVLRDIIKFCEGTLKAPALAPYFLQDEEAKA